MRGSKSKDLWLISKVEAKRMTFLTRGLAGGGSALPVFSFEQEAEAYLDSEPGDWHVRNSTPGELISVLSGPCAGVGWVLLDLPPRLDDARLLPDVVGVEREAFVERLLGSARAQNRRLSEAVSRIAANA